MAISSSEHFTVMLQFSETTCVLDAEVPRAKNKHSAFTLASPSLVPVLSCPYEQTRLVCCVHEIQKAIRKRCVSLRQPAKGKTVESNGLQKVVCPAKGYKRSLTELRESVLPCKRLNTFIGL